MRSSRQGSAAGKTRVCVLTCPAAPGRGCPALGGGHGAAGAPPSAGRTMGGGDRGVEGGEGRKEGRCDGSVWFTSLARPSLSPSPAAPGGAAVREGPAERQLLPAPAWGGRGGVSVTKRRGGGRPGGVGSSPRVCVRVSPSPYVEEGAMCLSWAAPTLSLLPGRDAGLAPAGSFRARRRAAPRQHPSPLPFAGPSGAFVLPRSRPASSRRARRWGSLRQRQTKAERRAQPPTSRPAAEERSAAPLSPPRPRRRAAPAPRRISRRGQAGGGGARPLPQRREEEGAGPGRAGGRHTKRRGWWWWCGGSVCAGSCFANRKQKNLTDILLLS